MKYCCPEHIDGCCQPVIDESPFREIRDKYANAHRFIYQVKCDCGGYVFRIVCDKNPTLIAVCPHCGKKITVFDMAEYTTGSKNREELEGILLRTGDGNEMFQLCVMYEYGELYRGADAVNAADTADAADMADMADMAEGSGETSESGKTSQNGRTSENDETSEASGASMAGGDFDFNDVSWGSVWACDEATRKITMVLDQETE